MMENISMNHDTFDVAGFAAIDVMIANALSAQLYATPPSTWSPSDSSTSGSLLTVDAGHDEGHPRVRDEARRRPIPSRGHTKSRMGCYNCKRRKVKCQETRPACDNCRKAGASCHYPAAKVAHSKASTRAAAPSTPAATSCGNVVLAPQLSLEATPVVFSLEDMQFFHRFLTGAYPRLPVGGSAIWQMDVARLAHEYDYVIHAMLAIGASRLALATSHAQAYETAALAHRVRSVESLNRALKTDARTRDEADARFAALMILTHQSACLTDGLTDFFTMLRGCVLAGATMHDASASCFAAFMLRRHFLTMESRFSDQQLRGLRRQSLESAAVSLERLAPRCVHPVEQQYHRVLRDMVQAAFVSPRTAYMHFMSLYGLVGAISAADFGHLLNPHNAICRILLSHFCAFHWIPRPLLELENPGQDISYLYSMVQTWCCLIHAGLDDDMRHLHEWPMNLVNHTSPWRDIDLEFDMAKAQKLVDDEVRVTPVATTVH